MNSRGEELINKLAELRDRKGKSNGDWLYKIPPLMALLYLRYCFGL